MECSKYFFLAVYNLAFGFAVDNYSMMSHGSQTKTYVNLCFVMFFVHVYAAGFYTANIPNWMMWLRYLAPLSYSLQALTKIEFGMGPLIR